MCLDGNADHWRSKYDLEVPFDYYINLVNEAYMQIFFMLKRVYIIFGPSVFEMTLF